MFSLKEKEREKYIFLKAKAEATESTGKLLLLCWVHCGWLLGGQQSCSVALFLSLARREYIMKGSWPQIRAGGEQLLSHAEQTQLREINVTYCQSESE